MNQFYSIAQVVVGLPVEGPFDYRIADEDRGRVRPGQRVDVLFNRTARTGYVVGLLSESAMPRLNTIRRVLDEDGTSLSEPMLRLSQRMSRYYGCSWGEAIETCLPAFLRKRRAIGGLQTSEMMVAQTSVYAPKLYLESSRSLLWSQLFQKIQTTVQRGANVIICVADRAQLHWLVKILAEHRVANVFTHQSTGSVPVVQAEWFRQRKAKGAVVVGLRSVIFSPVRQCGLIVVVDEDHPAFKQEQMPHYHLSRLAQWRAELESVELVLTSPSPLVETWSAAQSQKWPVEILERPQKPHINVVDMTAYQTRPGHMISVPLRNAIDEALRRKERVLVYCNHFGFYGLKRCKDCRDFVKCERCSCSFGELLAHKTDECGDCYFKKEYTQKCSSCGQVKIPAARSGLDRVGDVIRKLCPDARVELFDGTSTRIKSSAQVIVATQAIFRFRDVAVFDVVGMLHFERELNRADYQSGYQAYRVVNRLYQMARRHMIVQSLVVQDASLKALVSRHPQDFYQPECGLRHELNLPPYKVLIEVIVRSCQEANAVKIAHLWQERLLKDALEEPGDVSDVHPSSRPYLRGQFRYSVTVRTHHVEELMGRLKHLWRTFKAPRDVVITFDVSP